MGQKGSKLLPGRRGKKRGEVGLSTGAPDDLILKNSAASLSLFP